ncbi:MAG: Rieske 2Fe-2S domain-containing protein [Planctomycetota bacterium]|nr:Rieske 2Fe-2S domain-containing protein [Planctomycetota bacterium]
MSDEGRSTPSRRRVLEASVWISAGGMALALGLPGAAYLASPLLREDERVWVDLGPLEGLRGASGPIAVRFYYESRSGYVRARRPGLLWVVPDASAADGVLVLSPICSHKGCNVGWSTEEELFACPCHQGRFDSGGAVVSGPPDAPLTRVPIEVRDARLFAELGGEPA